MGDGRFEKLGTEIGALVETKQAAYGDSFGRSGEVLRQMYPNGVKPEQLDDMLAVARVVDKLFRIATDRDALGESPWRDVAGYGLLGAARVEASRAAHRPALAPPPRPGEPSDQGVAEALRRMLHDEEQRTEALRAQRDAARRRLERLLARRRKESGR